MAGERTIILSRREAPTKNGDYVFRREGVRASVYINKRIFSKGCLPDRITLTAEAEIYRLPVNLDHEATAERVHVLETKAARKRDLAERALQRAQELTEQAQKEVEKLDETWSP